MNIPALSARNPLISTIAKGDNVFWFNHQMDNVLSSEITKADIKDASDRLNRFSSYIAKAFPETAEAQGMIESPIHFIPNMAKVLSAEYAHMPLQGNLILKCDNLLPISGSIKARGGIYEVLCFAEKISLESGMLTKDDDYSCLADQKFKDMFSKYSIAVGSTGNLGLSIGIMGAMLGFKVTVHMSADARNWKKELLRNKGTVVIEYAGDYEKAVAEGRRQAELDPNCHFVDDENSRTLFLGYTVAAERLAGQLAAENIIVDEEHPLFVYLPCGVGGGPGGVAYGLKQIYGKHVHCFFAEPTQAPCMLLGVMTGLHEQISVQDIGLSGKTSADGLAVGRPSKLVGRTVGHLLDGLFTVYDETMEELVPKLYASEGIFAEPSATAGLSGYMHTQTDPLYFNRFGESKMKNSTHIAWATGGNMVPLDERTKYLNR